MSKGVNKAIIIGNLGKDPEVRYMPSGGAVTSFSIATSETWKDKDTGEQKEQTEWHKIVMFNKLAEIAGEFLKKGSKVFIQGKLRTRKYNDKNNVEKYVTEIVGDEMQMLDGKDSSQGKLDNSKQAGKAQQPQLSDDFDSDIPF